MKKININLIVPTGLLIVGGVCSLTGLYAIKHNIVIGIFLYGLSALFGIKGVLWRIFDELQKQNERMAKQTHSNNPKTAA